MNKYLLHFFVLSCIFFLDGKEAVSGSNENIRNRIDSLELVIKGDAPNDSLLMDAYFNLVRAFRSTQPDLAIKYAERSHELATELDYPGLMARALNDMGYLLWRLGNFAEALDKLENALEISHGIHDMSGYARTLNLIGGVYSCMGLNEKALEYYYNALSSLENIDSIARTAAVLNNIALIYLDQGDFERAEQYNLKSLSIKELFDNERGIAFTLSNLGDLYQQKGLYAKAMEYLESSLKYWKEHNDLRGIATTLHKMGHLYFNQKQHHQAIKLLNESRQISVLLNDQCLLVRTDHLLGEVFLALDSLDRAQDFFEQSLSTAKSIHMPALIVNNYKSLSDLMAERRSFKSAYKYHVKYLELHDSIYDAEGKQRILEIQLMYDRDKKNTEIHLLQKSNRINELNIEKERLLRNFLLTFIILILIILLIIYNRYHYYKKTNQLLNTQQKEISRNNKMLKELNRSLFEQNTKVDELNKELKASKQKLIDINKTKDQFFSIISHDLRSPFASIVSFSRIMKRDINNLSKEELQQLASELDKSVIKINNLLDNLLQWSRSQTGKLIYHPEVFNTKEIISDTINLFKANARDKKIELIENVDENIEVWADPNMVDTIIRNLVSNAIKYTDAGGKVTIETRVTGDMAEITVSDTGLGIAESDQEKLFRVDKLHSTFGTKDEKGSGLGLLLCKDFAKKQGGDISFTSTLGKGSVFTLTIPLNINE